MTSKIKRLSLIRKSLFHYFRALLRLNGSGCITALSLTVCLTLIKYAYRRVPPDSKHTGIISVPSAFNTGTVSFVCLFVSVRYYFMPARDVNTDNFLEISEVKF